MTPLERHCGWLLHAYPAWYRRERAGEMLGTLLEASPPGRRWPSFRDARALVSGGLRVRGWTWLLSMLWVAAGVVKIGYTFYNTTKPFSWADVTTGIEGIEGLSAYPVAVRDVVSIANWAWLALTLPVLIAGFIRLRGWRRGNWLRASAWAGTWIAGAALMAQANAWGQYPEGSCPNSYQNGLVCPIPSPAVVSWGELPVCAAWLVLGAVLTWILAVPARRSDVPNTPHLIAR
ncbi:MAG TPA: hypothetical protein VEL03_02645 [Streptosporangiaceae bacterium]|nr:hypothetical protein [Streptosporangiaceae bacterium]